MRAADLPQPRLVAGAWRRAIALLLDALVLGALSWGLAVLVVVLGNLAIILLAQIPGGVLIAGVIPLLIFALLLLLAAILPLALVYCTWGYHRGQTVGGIMLRVRVVNRRTGGAISARRALLRGMLLILCGGPFALVPLLTVMAAGSAWGPVLRATAIGVLLGYSWLLFSARRQPWVDRLAGTEVIRWNTTASRTEVCFPASGRR